MDSAYEITTNSVVEAGGRAGAAFTGALRFYDGDDKKWVEYVALFRRGELIPPIDCVERRDPEATP